VNKNNFTKKNIVDDLSENTGFSTNYSKKIINDFIFIISEEIKNNNFNLKNIGSFKLINKNERLGRNPKTNEKFIISSRKSISFTVSKKILSILNKNK
jgi:integration host factor subunit alpha